MVTLAADFVFTQSNLQDYVDCRRRFYLRYIQQQRYPAPEVDDLLEFERRMEQGERFHKLVHQHLVGVPVHLLQQRIADADVREWFEMYLAHGLDGMPQQRYPERTLSVPLGDYTLLAKYDVVAVGEDGAQIIDWKTSTKFPRREWMADKLQTRVYRYVLATGGAVLNNGNPIAPAHITMDYWYAQHNGKTIRFEYDEAQLQADEAYLLDLVADIESRAGDAAAFPKTDDLQRCKFCVYRSLCDRGDKAGSLEEWDGLDYDPSEPADFEIDIDQIAEIEF